jgi:methylglutaconyl-CoA hydratase
MADQTERERAEGLTQYQHIRVTRRGATAVVMLNRPEVHNAFNAPLIGDLSRAFAELAGDVTVRAVVLGGEGRTFCAGADLHWMRASMDFSREDNHADALKMADMLTAIDECPCPVIARIHGAALGGGAGLAAVCDIVIAAEDARFGFTEARLGIAPAVISPFAVRKIGVSHARSLFVTAERFSAARAQQIGLVHQVVPAEQLDVAVDATLAAIGQNSPAAVRASKQLARSVLALDPVEARRYTAQTIAELRVSPEGQEGIRAFLDKRPATWVTTDV